MNVDREKLIEDALEESGIEIYGEFLGEPALVGTKSMLTEFASLISAHAIASVQGDSEPVGLLEDWLIRNMPADTVIGDPKWWARQIRKVLSYENRVSLKAPNDDDRVKSVSDSKHALSSFEFKYGKKPEDSFKKFQVWELKFKYYSEGWNDSYSPINFETWWNSLDDASREQFNKSDAITAFNAGRSQLSTNTDGWVRVPIEPTDAMTDAADDVFHAVWKEQREYALRVHGKEGYASEPFALGIYKAMIDAELFIAPPHPQDVKEALEAAAKICE